MNPPTPREESQDWLRTLLTQHNEGLREVKESINSLARDMNSKMSVLVSQREFDRTRDDLTIDIGEVRAKIDNGLVRHDADIQSVRAAAEANVKALKDALDAAELRRRNERWTALGILVALLGLGLTVVLHYM